MTTTEHQPTPAPDEGPLLPMWARDKATFTSTSRQLRKRTGYRARKFLLHLPATLFWMVGWYPWFGLARVTKRVSQYLYDYDSAMVRHEHAGRVETPEYARANNIRKANLKARWLVASAVVMPVAVPILAWTYPQQLSAAAGVVLAVWIIKLIPGRGLGEIVVAGIVGAAVYRFGPDLLAHIPRPKAWATTLVLSAGWVGLGFLGKPTDRTLTGRDDPHEAGIVVKPTAPMVVDALIRLGVAGLTDKTREDVRVFAPGVARSRRGYHLSLELPAGVTAASVMDKREEFAAALRRELGTIWPSKGPRHPGHLDLFISDEPMVTAPQGRWPVAERKPLDIFQPIPLFTDQEGKWVDLTLAYNQLVVGGAPGFGKSFAVRELGVAAAFDPRVRIVTLDGKGNGDLRPLRLVAHGFYEGDEADEIAEQLSALRVIREEMRRRARFLRDLPRDENPLSKVTSELCDRYTHLAPIVLLVDEVQVYTEYEDKVIRAEFISIMTDLVKRGRSSAIIPVFCTQKPDATALPSAIADNCSIRLCFRVNTAGANNQVLGNGMYASGIKATLFSIADKGLAWLRGDGGDPMVVRTVHGLDAVAAEELMGAARAIRAGRGLLTGDAADEVAEAEAEQVALLEDVRKVFTEASALHLEDIVTALAALRPDLYSHLDNTSLPKLLRSAGVRVDTVYVAGKPRDKSSNRGVKREWLEVSTTKIMGDESDTDGF